MTAVVPTRRLLMLPEAADRLRVSVRTVHRLIETGEFPAVRLGPKGHAIRVDAQELEHWLASRSTAGEAFPATVPAERDETHPQGSRLSSPPAERKEGQ